MPEPKSGEAVCFTAGAQGAAFGAGVVHAWLASDRPKPLVVAGISTGAVTAAAMQRAMIERDRTGKRTEATRWEWFGKYLTDILDRPLDVVWKAIPDPVDFQAVTTPVRDLSCPDGLKDDEVEARYHFWILTKLGKWFASLPISVGELGTLAVFWVRLKEQIPLPVLGPGPVAKAWRRARFGLQAVSIGLQLI